MQKHRVFIIYLPNLALFSEQFVKLPKPNLSVKNSDISGGSELNCVGEISCHEVISQCLTFFYFEHPQLKQGLGFSDTPTSTWVSNIFNYKNSTKRKESTVLFIGWSIHTISASWTSGFLQFMSWWEEKWNIKGVKVKYSLCRGAFLKKEKN